MKRLKNSKEAGTHREALLEQQNGVDPITEALITDAVLDHYHDGNQHCRAALQRESNSFEGKVYNSYKRYIKHLTDKPLPEILRNLANYLEKYNNIPEEEQVIHHTALRVDVNRFKRMSADKQRSILMEYGVIPEKNAGKRANQARKLIKTNKLDIKKYGE